MESEPGPGGRLYAESVGYPPGWRMGADKNVYHTTDTVQMQDKDSNCTGVGIGRMEGGSEKQPQRIGGRGPDMALPGGFSGGTDVCCGESA